MNWMGKRAREGNEGGYNSEGSTVYLLQIQDRVVHEQ